MRLDEVKRGSPSQVVVVISMAIASACASSRPDPVTPSSTKTETSSGALHETHPSANDSDDDITIQGETTGEIDEQSLHRALERELDRANACFGSVDVQRRPYLGGTIELRFRVEANGALKHLFVIKSTVGAIGVERCVRDAFKKVKLPTPKQGAVELTYPLTYPSREPIEEWQEEMVRDELKKARKRLVTQRAPKGLSTTFYVDRGGHVVSASVFAEEPLSDRFVDEFLETLTQLKFVEPQTTYAKVTYSFR